MANKRIHWVDITKGVLIFLMVWGHINNISGIEGVDNTYIKRFYVFSSLYSCFYMQAFIILTGYTSNFDKGVKPYLLSIIKTVLIPWFVFSTITLLYRYYSGSEVPFYNINNQKYFFLIEDYWFLQVLFFGKFIYYFINKYIKSDVTRAIILLFIMFCGFSIFAAHSDVETTYHYNNFLHYKDLLCMLFYLWIGNFCKRHGIIQQIKGTKLIIVLSLFLFGHLLRFVFRKFGIDELLIAPVTISHGGNAISPAQMPAYIYYVILGSFSCFGIMQKVNEHRFLEYIGRNSLVIYCTHFVFLRLIICIVNKIVPPISMINSLFYIVLTLILCLLSCMGVIALTKFKPFNYLIGKF